ncbi:hypothetical protein D3C73_1609630 [compost metagenome]
MNGISIREGELYRHIGVLAAFIAYGNCGFIAEAFFVRARFVDSIGNVIHSKVRSAASVYILIEIGLP